MKRNPFGGGPIENEFSAVPRRATVDQREVPIYPWPTEASIKIGVALPVVTDVSQSWFDRLLAWLGVKRK